MKKIKRLNRSTMKKKKKSIMNSCSRQKMVVKSPCLQTATIQRTRFARSLKKAKKSR